MLRKYCVFMRLLLLLLDNRLRLLLQLSIIVWLSSLVLRHITDLLKHGDLLVLQLLLLTAIV